MDYERTEKFGVSTVSALVLIFQILSCCGHLSTMLSFRKKSLHIVLINCKTV